MANDPNRAAVVAAPDRQQAVQNLYIRNFDFILELIHSDPGMSADAANQILDGIAKHLPDYSGPLTNVAFQKWVTEIIVPVVGFYAIRRVCQPFVRKAIWEGLGHSTEPSKYDDYPETVKELEQEVWIWAFLNQEKLTKPGKAKITTRLFARAKVMTSDWMKRQRTRRFAVIRRVYNLPGKAKIKAAAQNLAAALDREAVEGAQRRAESEEIQLEMKKLELMA